MELDTKIILVIAIVAFSTILIGEAFGEEKSDDQKKRPGMTST